MRSIAMSFLVVIMIAPAALAEEVVLKLREAPLGRPYRLNTDLIHCSMLYEAPKAVIAPEGHCFWCVLKLGETSHLLCIVGEEGKPPNPLVTSKPIKIYIDWDNDGNFAEEEPAGVSGNTLSIEIENVPAQFKHNGNILSARLKIGIVPQRMSSRGKSCPGQKTEKKDLRFPVYIHTVYTGSVKAIGDDCNVVWLPGQKAVFHMYRLKARNIISEGRRISLGENCISVKDGNVTASCDIREHAPAKDKPLVSLKVPAELNLFMAGRDNAVTLCRPSGGVVKIPGGMYRIVSAIIKRKTGSDDWVLYTNPYHKALRFFMVTEGAVFDDVEPVMIKKRMTMLANGRLKFLHSFTDVSKREVFVIKNGMPARWNVIVRDESGKVAARLGPEECEGWKVPDGLMDKRLTAEFDLSGMPFKVMKSESFVPSKLTGKPVLKKSGHHP